MVISGRNIACLLACVLVACGFAATAQADEPAMVNMYMLGDGGGGNDDDEEIPDQWADVREGEINRDVDPDFLDLFNPPVREEEDDDNEKAYCARWCLVPMSETDDDGYVRECDLIANPNGDGSYWDDAQNDWRAVQEHTNFNC